MERAPRDGPLEALNPPAHVQPAPTEPGPIVPHQAVRPVARSGDETGERRLGVSGAAAEAAALRHVPGAFRRDTSCPYASSSVVPSAAAAATAGASSDTRAHPDSVPASSISSADRGLPREPSTSARRAWVGTAQ